MKKVYVNDMIRLLCDWLSDRVLDFRFGSRLWCLTVSLLLSHWCPGSGVVLDCIDSCSFHPCLH